MKSSKEILMGLPSKVNPAVLQGLSTVFHFIIKNDSGTDESLTISVEEGKCSAEEGLTGEAKCVVTASDENLAKLLRGELNPMMALLTGKLKISNQAEMLRYAKIFGLM
ncbi:SCP2 sterol-binding domain-containing protein [Membranihabitans marinus]|uniref:SCP2 sterol-binding domain-containing protein n=1 Tax=Membranihabitans marinus TaxID=1227546 RepID=UPI001F3FF912|nr:SCP2 sterol-binding domain-containing protein [Membranihabitans marinus]